MREVDRTDGRLMDHDTTIRRFIGVTVEELNALRKEAGKHVNGRNLTDEELAAMEHARLKTGITPALRDKKDGLGYNFGGYGLSKFEVFEKSGKLAYLFYRRVGSSYSVSFSLSKPQVVAQV